MKNSASGVLNGVRRHWTDNGAMLPSHREILALKISEYRKLFQHNGRGGQQLAELEREYVAAFGLLQFVKCFDWFSKNTPEV